MLCKSVAKAILNWKTYLEFCRTFYIVILVVKYSVMMTMPIRFYWVVVSYMKTGAEAIILRGLNVFLSFSHLLSLFVWTTVQRSASNVTEHCLVRPGEGKVAFMFTQATTFPCLASNPTTFLKYKTRSRTLCAMLLQRHNIFKVVIS
jgi:hypothetical protein